MENKFIKRYTKSNCVANAVLSGIALITLIMLTLLLNVDSDKKTLIAFLYTVALAFISTLGVGIIQIKVFNDYKSQKKALCAEGIFIICLGALLIITAVLFGVMQGGKIVSGELDTIDIRYFITIFLLAFAVWKAIVVYQSLKEKRFNWWLELVSAILWLVFAGLTLTSIFAKGSLNVIMWLFVAFGWLMIISNITYQLYSYIFKTPTYLETPEALALLSRDNKERENRIARLNALTGATDYQAQPQTQPQVIKVEKQEDDLETKLAKLKGLLDKNIITQEEYDEKRKQIIKESL